MQSLDPEKAYSIAGRLTTIPDFPRNEEAIEATAEDLIRWCRGSNEGEREWSPEAQAIWTVEKARESWNSWIGSAALKSIFDSKFVILPTQPLNLGERPPIDCRRCGDTGVVQNATGRYEWCGCDQADRMRVELPDWLQFMNREKPKRTVKPLSPWPADLKPITQADIDAAVIESRRQRDEEITRLAKRELLDDENLGPIQ
jgi:hypothetical protein